MPKAESSAAAENGDGDGDAGEGKEGVRSTDPEWPRVGDLFWGRVKARLLPRTVSSEEARLRSPPWRLIIVAHLLHYSSAGARLVARALRETAERT